MTIIDWPEGDWPREKLLAKGAPAQSDAELLAIYLRTGVVCCAGFDFTFDLSGLPNLGAADGRVGGGAFWGAALRRAY